MKTFSLLSWNAHPRRVRLSRPQVAARLCVTEPSSHYWKCLMVTGGVLMASWVPLHRASLGPGRQPAKTNTLRWNLDSPCGPNSVSEWCCGCLDCSRDLAQCHAKDPGIYPCCFPANKSSKYLEHCGVQCQDTAPPRRDTGSSLVLTMLEPVKLLCTMLLKRRILSRRARWYWLSVRRVPVLWVPTQHLSGDAFILC